MLASSKGHTAVVQVLIAAGANLELSNKVSGT
jgi:ankyrin repeat protein